MCSISRHAHRYRDYPLDEKCAGWKHDNNVLLSIIFGCAEPIERQKSSPASPLPVPNPTANPDSNPS